MPGAGRGTRRATWRRRAVLAAGALSIGALAACGDASGASARVVIPPGATMRVAADSLASAGVIRFPGLFRLYVRATGRDRIVKPGTYLLARDASWNAVTESLVRGRGLVFTVAIPEGWNVAAIVEAVARDVKIPAESLQAAVRDSALRRRLDLPTPTLEGYLFPATYTFPDGASASEVVRAMVREFERRWKPEWNERLQALAMSRHDIVTLASIVELEARVPEERPVISAVYHNRLKRGMALQADPTVQYALGRHVSRVLYRDLQVDSRYNTYRYRGLPPGPIASPGTASLEAALFPADVPFLYFVAHPDGHHEFRRTFREHNEAVRQMRALRREAEQRARIR